MDRSIFPVSDSSLSLLTQGYAWLPDLWRRQKGTVVHTRLMGGQRAVALRGPEAVRFFYDERNILRRPALPEPVLSTLFGHGGVHSLDGDFHRLRKAMFISMLMEPGAVEGAVEQVTAAWDESVATWAGRRRVVLFDAAAEAITRGTCRWAGVPVAGPRDGVPEVWADEVPGLARDLVAMVDGFATPGARHWRARLARRRREAWLAGMVGELRAGRLDPPPHSILRAAAAHRDVDGSALEPRVAAVEVLNVLRPTCAVAWFVAFAGHAMHRWPRCRDRLREGDPAYAEAFAHELRRFYPFAPFVGGRALRDLTWDGERIPRGTIVLLDLYGQNHDGSLWPAPYDFDPERFAGREIGPYALVPQGGGDPRAGHRCPGEPITVALVRELSVRLARLDYDVPEQDLSISLRRMPARPRSGVLIENVIENMTAGRRRTPAASATSGRGDHA